jgi:hypothetical protein
MKRLNHTEAAFRMMDGKLFAVFFDYSKASDMVNRTKLLKKLQQTIRPEHTDQCTEDHNSI